MAVLRDVRADDLPFVREINEQSVPAMNSLSSQDLEWFAEVAEYFRVAEVGGEIAAFLICLRPGTPYGSLNLAWLDRRFDDFLYIDRVAVAAPFRRNGLGTALYMDAARHAAGRYRSLACEVNLRPRNEASIRYHEQLGFTAYGTQDHGDVEVQYMLVPLPLERGGSLGGANPGPATRASERHSR